MAAVAQSVAGAIASDERNHEGLNETESEVAMIGNGEDRGQEARHWVVAGAVGGVAGGIAMTVLMTRIAPRVVPADARPNKPAPQKVVEWAERQVHKPQALPQKPKKATALATHLGYSAVTGAGYGFARHQLPGITQRVPTPASGVLFGLIVWAVSFEGLLPLLGVMPRTTEHPPKRRLAPMMGHAVFGAVTAVVASAVQSHKQTVG